MSRLLILYETKNILVITIGYNQCKKTSLVQLVERKFPKLNVVGSSPTGRDNEYSTP